MFMPTTHCVCVSCFNLLEDIKNPLTLLLPHFVDDRFLVCTCICVCVVCVCVGGGGGWACSQ